MDGLRTMRIRRRQFDQLNNDPVNIQNGAGMPPAASKTSMIIAITVLVAIFAASTGTFLILRYYTRSNKPPPKWFPSFLRNASSQGTYARASSRAESESNSRHRNSATNSSTEMGAAAAADLGVTRGQSVRSIMTLPEYRPVAKPGFEETIAKEGERGGVDVIVEFPETAEEEERRREDHMQLLFEVRQVRAAEREERRLRREARRRGERPPPRTANLNASSRVQSLLNVGAVGDTTDTGTGNGNIEDGPRNRTVSGSISTMSRAELLALIQGPPKKLPQVAYAEIGTVKPDGTRVRPSTPSSESEYALLDSPSVRGNGASSQSIHSRNFSNSSILTMNSLTPSTIYGSEHRSASSLSMRTVPISNIDVSRDSLDLGLQRRGTLPPLYDNLDFEDAPAYESPRVRLEVEIPVPELRITGINDNPVSLEGINDREHSNPVFQQ